LLIVDFVEARNLIPVEKSGKSEPLLKAWLFRPRTSKDVIGETYSTIKNVGKTLDPQWNESFPYGQTYDLHSLSDIPLTLHVEICHKILSAKMGFCEIPLETISGTVDQCVVQLFLPSRGRAGRASGREITHNTRAQKNAHLETTI